jgi:hypothetical protein
MDWTWIGRGFGLAVGVILAACTVGVIFVLLWLACALIVQSANERRERRWAAAASKHP